MNPSEFRKRMLALPDEDLGRAIRAEVLSFSDVVLGRYYRQFIRNMSDEQFVQGVGEHRLMQNMQAQEDAASCHQAPPIEFWEAGQDHDPEHPPPIIDLKRKA